MVQTKTDEKLEIMRLGVLLSNNEPRAVIDLSYTISQTLAQISRGENVPNMQPVLGLFEAYARAQQSLGLAPALTRVQILVADELKRMKLSQFCHGIKEPNLDAVIAFHLGLITVIEPGRYGEKGSYQLARFHQTAHEIAERSTAFAPKKLFAEAVLYDVVRKYLGSGLAVDVAELSLDQLTGKLVAAGINGAITTTRNNEMYAPPSGVVRRAGP